MGRGARYFPTDKSCFLTPRPPAPPCRDQFPFAHCGFVGGDDFVGGAVLADVAVVDPDDTVAEAANLVELMGDEDDGATRAGHVAHLAQAFFLES